MNALEPPSSPPAEITEPPSIEVLDLVLGYDRASGFEVAFGPATFSISPGETISIVGPSGSGKSTFLNSLLGELSPVQGKIEFSGESKPGGKTSVVFQENTVFPWLSAVSNVAYPLRVNGVQKKLARSQAAFWLEKLGLGESLNKYPSQLSGGMLQRVALARALAHQPSLLVLDEPFGQLDEITRFDLVSLLSGLLSEFNTTSVLVTHSIDEAILLADRVFLISSAPGRLASIFEVSSKKPRSRQTMQEPEFFSLRNKIISSLQEEMSR